MRKPTLDQKQRSIGAATCRSPKCGQRIAQGDWMVRVGLGKFMHLECWQEL